MQNMSSLMQEKRSSAARSYNMVQRAPVWIQEVGNLSDKLKDRIITN
jgi:hypothetical protein